MVEATACGSPVVAYRKGPVAEIVEDGTTGFGVDPEEEACEALRKVGSLDRQYIRNRFEERFTASIMANTYVDVFERVIRNAGVFQEAKRLVSAAKTDQRACKSDGWSRDSGADDIDLPRLVVVGDQSSGKSSMLESLTGLPFPRDRV